MKISKIKSLCCYLGIFSAAVAVASARPNFIVIQYEDVSPLFGCYGVPTARTPAVDKLADEGIVYRNYHGVSAVCAPNRSGWITGVHPASLGTHHMRTSAASIGEVLPYSALLNDAGYYTVNHCKLDYNFRPPADEWSWRDTAIGDEPGPFWRQRPEPEQPFFVVYNFTCTHMGHVQGDPAYARSGGSLPPEQKIDRSAVVVPAYLPDTPAVREALARTQDNITLADQFVDEIYKALAADGLLDDTWIFFMSDHGNGGLPRAKTYLYDSGLQAPMVVRPPTGTKASGVPADGSDFTELVSFADISSTILSLAGVSVPAYNQGRVFLGAGTEPEPAALTAAHDRINGRIHLARAVRTTEYKYIRNYQPWKPLLQEIPGFEKGAAMKSLRAEHKAGNLSPEVAQFLADKRPAEELYYLPEDPDEVLNLAEDPAHAAVLAEMRGHLAQRYLTQGDLGFIPEGMMVRMGNAAGSRRALITGDHGYSTVDAESWASFDQLAPTPDSELVKAFNSGDPIARYHVCMAIGNRRALPSGITESDLTGLLSNTYGDLRGAAGRALLQCNLAMIPAKEALISVIETGIWQERLNILNMIDYLDDPAPFFPAVQAHLKEWEKRGYRGRHMMSERYCVEQCRVILQRHLN